MSLKRRRRLVVYTVLVLLAFGVAGAVVLRPGGGSILSPGKLSKAHASLEGEAHCADCHVANAGLDDKLCLACHETLKKRIDQGTGFHAGVKTACDTCHAEHLGLEARLVRWPAPDDPYRPIQQGKAKKEDFPHQATTGFALEGAHGKLQCDGCHRPSLIADAKVIEFVKGHETFLGAPTDCAGCHVDAHTPTLGPDCASCHGVTAWRPVERFQHDKTRFPLVGKHAQVKCDDCHVGEVAGAPLRPPPPPVPTFQALVPASRPPPFRGAGFGKVEPSRGDALPSCRACHDNPHRTGAGAFGRCEDCHTAHDWKNSGEVARGASFDHATTGFPLAGAHARVTCVACHGPKLDLAARTSCQDCHTKDDPHKGAFDREMLVARKTCDACHSVDAWKPSTYQASKHPLPLIEAHAVKCEDCHGTDKHRFPRLPARAPASIGPLDQSCVACHTDAHQGKLGQDCASCHGFKSFHLAELSVEGHAELGFPIRDAHLKATCDGCHGARTPSGGLRQLALADVRTQGCVACHTGDDPHRGQLSKDCKSCHTEVKFVPSTYDEVRHQRARLPLQGAHRAVPCEACHVRDVQPPPLQQRFHWEGRAMRCDACHTTDDPHRGQFRGQDCASCHSQDRWSPSTFGKSAHAQTGFPLNATHDQPCAACHVKGTDPGLPADVVTYKGTPRECAACHLDPHMGQFAGRGGKDGCFRCHGLLDWKPSRFEHDEAPTRFPLTGKHRQVECAACHVSAQRPAPGGGTRKVTHYFPIDKRACDDCHQNPHRR